jgi:hypothetical protein
MGAAGGARIMADRWRVGFAEAREGPEQAARSVFDAIDGARPFAVRAGLDRPHGLSDPVNPASKVGAMPVGRVPKWWQSWLQSTLIVQPFPRTRRA